MGLPLPDDNSPNTQKSSDMQRYYSQTYREYVTRNENVTFSARHTTAQIFSKTKTATDTHSNRDLAFLDIDKLISLNTGSLKVES